MSIRLSNGLVDVEIAPEIGRITAFSRTGRPSLLWMNPTPPRPEDRAAGAWMNWGGDKVWPSHQAGWALSQGRGWPPDSAFDGDPFRVVDQAADRITIQGANSPHLQVSLKRQIILPAGQAALVIRNTMTRTAANPFAVHIWSVTQTRVPQLCLMEVAADRPLALPFVLMNKAKSPGPEVRLLDGGGALHIPGPQPEGMKWGTFGRWIAAAFEGDLLVQTTGYRADGCFPDASNIQFFHGASYIELETLTDCVHLKPGESMSNTVRWDLLERPAGASADALAQLAARTAGSAGV